VTTSRYCVLLDLHAHLQPANPGRQRGQLVFAEVDLFADQQNSGK
jgi:hypothetical protein